MALRSTCAQTLPSPAPTVSSGRIEQHLVPGARRQQVIIRPPRTWVGDNGEILVEPNVSVVEMAPLDPMLSDNDGYETASGSSGLLAPYTGPLIAPPEGTFLPGQIGARSVLAPELLPSPTGAIAEPVFGHLLEDAHHSESGEWPLCSGGCDSSPWPFSWMSNQWADGGLGREHVMNALFEIDNTQPMNNVRLRLDAAYHVPYPDRAEYYWSGLRGPQFGGLGELSMDYQDFRMMMEVGGKKFSVQTEIPIRVIDPVRNANTAGLGDMSVTTKTVIVDKSTWQLTQILKTYMNTGSASHGTGTGHVSMEPGLLCRYKWNEGLFIHSELKYWFPIGGDPLHSGQALRYGMGFSWLWLESDTFALMPTWEMVGWSVLDGLETLPDGTPQQVDGCHIFNIYPGLRCVFDPQSDLGVWEVGINGGFSLSQNHWYRGLVRVELRILF